MTGICRRSIALSMGHVWLVLLAMCGTSRLTAEENATGPSAEAPIAYRRIYVPAEDTAAWPREGEKYLPVEARDFEAWVTATNPADTSTLPAAKITEAIYTARLEGEQLVNGVGEWTISHAIGRRALVKFESTSLAIRELRWKDDSSATLRFGAWGRSGGLPSTMGLEVGRSGVVTFDWHLAAVSKGDMAFVWRLPPATTTRLILDLPSGKRPIWEGGLVLNSEELDESAVKPETTSVGERAQARSERVKPGRYVRWELIAGANPQPTLRIVDEQAGPAAASEAPTFVMREVLAYDITPRGLDVEAQLYLEEEAAAGRRQLSVPLAAGVQLVSATVDGHDVTWRLASDGPAMMNRAIIELPSPASGGAVTVLLRGWQSPVTDAPWQLPKLRPEDVFWTAGSVRLSLAPHVKLRSIKTTDCVQTGVHLADANDSPEKISLSEYSPDATVEVEIGRSRPAVKSSTGTTLVVGNADVTGRSITRLEVTQGSLHKLSGELPTGWTVDAVECNPTEALAEWYVDDGDGRRQLEVQFAEAVRPGRPVTLTLTGRLQPTNLSAPLSAATLRMVRWRDVELARQLVSVQTPEPYVVESMGELPVVSGETLTGADRGLLPAAAGGPVYDVRNVDDSAAVRLSTKKAQYTSEVWLDAVYAGDELRQSYHVVIRPKVGRVDHVLVYASEKLDGDVRWIDKASGKPITIDRIPASDPRRGALPVEGELWRLHLSRPQDESVEIDATLVTAWRSRRSVPLLTLPEATDQRGRVLLSVATDHLPKLDVRGPRAIPLPTTWAGATHVDAGARLWAAYRYDPVDCLGTAGRPELWIDPAGTSSGGAFVRQLSLESFYTRKGEATHRATYRMESPFAVSVQLRAPAEAQITSAELDGRALDFPTEPSGGNSLTIPLIAGRPANVAICLSSNEFPLSSGCRLAVPCLESDLPILASEWKVWLPTEFVVVGADAAPDATNWRKRLFGPLGRPMNEPPFDPKDAASWSKLLTGWAEEGPAAGSTRGDDIGTPASEEAIIETGEPAPSGVEAVTRDTSRTMERSGWRSYRRRFVAGLPEPIVVAHPPATTAWSVAIFLVCLAGGGVVRFRRNWFIGLVAMTAILCLLLPVAFAPLATGAFLGLLMSLFARWPRRADPADAPTRTWTRLATAGATGTALVFVLTNFVAAQSTSDSVGANDSIDIAKIQRVLVPVDAERRPTGTKVYVSEPFLRRLLVQSAEFDADGSEWLLTKAAYHCELRHSPDVAETIAGNWRMTLGIEVLSRDTTIRLPIVRDEADWPTTVQVDGIPTPLKWDADGRSASMIVAEPGRYELSISFLPLIREVEVRNQIELTLPPWRGAAFELRIPAEMTGVEVAGGNLQRRDDRSTGVMSGELDDSGRISVRWARTEASAGKKDTQITELRRLKIGTSGAEMDIKYVVPRDARLPKELVIAADGRWELLNDEDSSRGVHVVRDSGGRNAVRVVLGADDRDRGEVLLRWRLLNPPGLGRLRLPPIELSTSSAATYWLAISNDPVLECEIVDAAGLRAETGEEFLNLWGSDEDRDTPQLVLENVPSAKGLVVGLRPRAAESAIDEVLHVAAGNDALRVQYQAEVEPGLQHRFQYSMLVPDELNLNQITVTETARPIPVRWSRPTASRVNVFFSEPLNGPYRLILAGHVPVRGATECPLPRVASASLNSVVERVQLYRDDATLVDVAGPANADDAAADLPPAGWSARLVGAYQVYSNSADEVRLALRPNRVETAGETLTTLDHEETLWWAAFHARLEVRRGELDAIRLRVPTNWAGPFDVQPADVNVSMTSPADGHAILTVRFPESIGLGEAVALDIRGPVAPESGVPVSVPQIDSLPPAEWRSYISVPSAVQSQDVPWTRDGVKPEEPPANLRPPRTNPVPTKTFQVMSRPYRVALAPPQAAQPTAAVRLADTVVVRSLSGKQLVSTRFVIAPQGLVDCELQLPEHQQLVSVNLDGRPARIRELDSRRWAVALGAPQLPQMLDVVSCDAHAAIASPAQVDLQRPAIFAGGATIPVEMSLWSFGQWRITAQPRVSGASLVHSVDQAGLRLDRLASIAEAATPAAVAMPIPDGYDWYRAWAGLLTDVQDGARATLVTAAREGVASQVTRSGGELLAPAAERIATWVERSYDVLGWPDLGPPLDPPGAADSRAAWPPATEGMGGWIYCIADGSSDRMTIELSRADAPAPLAPYVGALAIVVVAVTSTWLVRKRAASDWLHRWPHAAGVLVGVFCWACLWPSWLGLVIAAGSLLFLFRPGWPGKSLRAEGSTVLQMGQRR